VRLRTTGNRIVDAATGTPVRLRGVNWSGLEYSNEGPRQGEIATIVGEWSSNIIRLPFNQKWALLDDGYRQELDRAIQQAEHCGAYTLLDLHWMNDEIPYGGDNFVPPLPNPESIDVWRMLAWRYRDRPSVLFDLFNEPHDPLVDDPYPLVAPDGALLRRGKVRMEEWRPWALALIDAIREVHPQSLIFVSGTEWGYDLRGFPLDRENIVYSTHVYEQRGTDWHGAFGRLASTAPVFAGEWGGTNVVWGQRLAEYFDGLEIGWTAWSWCDEPRLQRDGTATEFGEFVRSRLRGSPERLGT
jgi:endoglucanase